MAQHVVEELGDDLYEELLAFMTPAWMPPVEEAGDRSMDS